MKTPWFDWGEEKREHWDLEKLLHRLDLTCSEEEPEPSQAGNPGSAANRLGVLKGCPDGWGGRLYPSVSNRGNAPIFL